MKKTRFLKRSTAFIAAMTLSIPVCAYDQISADAASSNAEMVVQYAKSKTYITSRPNEVTQFYGLVCDWCSMFVYYCAYKTGVGSSVPNTTFCDSQYGYKGGVEIFKSWGKWSYSAAKGGSYTPVTGDIIYYDWNLDGYSDHVGFVDKVSDGYVYTVEGNSGTYGDCVKMNKYPLTYGNILGYGRPDYGDSKAPAKNTAVPRAAAVTTTTAPASTKSAVTTTVSAPKRNVKLPSVFKVSSPVGAWLREDASSTGRKIGVLSTGKLVIADDIKGDWVHINSAETEDGKKSDGWVSLTNLSFVINIASVPETDTSATTAAVTTAPVTSAVTTTTTATTTVTTAAVTFVTQAESTKSARSTEEPADVYKVDSPIGAWFRSSAKIENGNCIGIADTDQTVYVLDSDGEWAYSKVSFDGGMTYFKGYIHLSTIVPEGNENETGETIPYKVISSIGCRMRKSPDTSADNTIAILDTDEMIEAVGVYGEWIFAKTSCGKYGFVHSSNIEQN